MIKEKTNIAISEVDNLLNNWENEIGINDATTSEIISKLDWIKEEISQNYNRLSEDEKNSDDGKYLLARLESVEETINCFNSTYVDTEALYSDGKETGQAKNDFIKEVNTMLLTLES